MIIEKFPSNFNELADKFRIRTTAATQQGRTVFLAQMHDFRKFGRGHGILGLPLGINDGISGIWFT